MNFDPSNFVSLVIFWTSFLKIYDLTILSSRLLENHWLQVNETWYVVRKQSAVVCITWEFYPLKICGSCAL